MPATCIRLTGSTLLSPNRETGIKVGYLAFAMLHYKRTESVGSGPSIILSY